MKCPYCDTEYNSIVTFNVHKESCFYKDNPVQVDYEAMPYFDLKSLAMSNGIKAANMKKTEIINALKETEG